jgi:hypothetical protein
MSLAIAGGVKNISVPDFVRRSDEIFVAASYAERSPQVVVSGIDPSQRNQAILLRFSSRLSLPRASLNQRL